jgi:hypothetical protein
MRKCVVESAAEELGKRTVAFVMETPQIPVDFLSIISCLFVAFPRIHGKATSVQSVTHYCFAERRIRDPIMSTKFNYSSWLSRSDNPMSEGNVTVPGTDNACASPRPEQWVQIRREQVV